MADKPTLASAVTERIGNFLSIIALLFAVKLTALGAIYKEVESVQDQGVLENLCREELDVSELSSLIDNVLPIVQLIDISFSVIAAFGLIVGVSALSHALSFRKFTIKDRPEFFRAIPMVLIFSVLFAFAASNVGVTGYVHGMSDATIEHAPELQAWFDSEDRSQVCEYLLQKD